MPMFLFELCCLLDAWLHILLLLLHLPTYSLIYLHDKFLKTYIFKNCFYCVFYLVFYFIEIHCSAQHTVYMILTYYLFIYY